MVGEKAPRFRLDYGQNIEGFYKILVRVLLFGAQRPFIGLLPKVLNLGEQFIVGAEFDEAARELRRKGVGDWLQNTIEVAYCAHA